MRAAKCELPNASCQMRAFQMPVPRCESILALSNNPLIFSYCNSVIVSCSHCPVLLWRHALLFSCSQGLALSCVCAPMVSRSHVFILSSSHALMLSFSRAIMMLSVCRLYRKYRRIIVRNQNASPLNIADERAKRASKAVS